MTSESMTISLDEFIKYFMKKWKITALIVAFCTVAFVGATQIIGEEITVPHSEEYLYYEKESAWLEKYMKESVLMQINPTEIYERTLFLENISEAKKLKSYVMSVEIWDEFETAYNKNYYNELLRWEKNENRSAELTIRHATEAECAEAAEYIEEKIRNYDQKSNVVVGEERVVTDEELQDEQLRWYDRIEYSKSLLLEAEAGYTIKVNIVAAAVTGIISGGILAVVAELLMYLRDRKIK